MATDKGVQVYLNVWNMGPIDPGDTCVHIYLVM